MLADTWYTLVDYTGKGAFTSVWAHNVLAGVAGLYVKLTFDGGAPLEIFLNTDQLDETLNRDYGGGVHKNIKLDWGLIGFDTSLKVEFKHQNAVDLTIACFWQTIA